MQMALYQSWADIGGADLWLASWYTPNQRWYTGWHTPRDMAFWHCTKPWQWQLIGWELWKGERLSESYYICPNPGLTPKYLYDPKAPKTGLERTFYDEEGLVVDSEWVLDERVWKWRSKQDLFKGNPKGGKGEGKGNPKGGKGKGKSKSSSDGKGTGKGRPKGGKGKGQGTSSRYGKGKGTKGQ